MDGVGLGVLGDADHLFDGEVGLDRAKVLAEVLRLADLIGLVGLEAVERELVLLGIDRDRRDAEFGGRAENSDGDLGAVGDEQAAEGHGHTQA